MCLFCYRGRLKKRGPSDKAYNPCKLDELNARRPYPLLYGMISSINHQTPTVCEQIMSMHPESVQQTAQSALAHGYQTQQQIWPGTAQPTDGGTMARLMTYQQKMGATKGRISPPTMLQSGIYQRFSSDPFKLQQCLSVTQQRSSNEGSDEGNLNQKASEGGERKHGGQGQRSPEGQWNATEVTNNSSCQFAQQTTTQQQQQQQQWYQQQPQCAYKYHQGSGTSTYNTTSNARYGYGSHDYSHLMSASHELGVTERSQYGGGGQYNGHTGVYGHVTSHPGVSPNNNNYWA